MLSCWRDGGSRIVAYITFNIEIKGCGETGRDCRVKNSILCLNVYVYAYILMGGLCMVSVVVLRL